MERFNELLATSYDTRFDALGADEDGVATSLDPIESGFRTAIGWF